MKSADRENLAVAVTFGGDTRVTSLSGGIGNDAGFSQNEIIGESVAHVLADRTVFQLPQILDTVRAEGMWEGEVSFRDDNDKLVPTYGTVLPLSAGTDRNSGYLLLARPIRADGGTDVTEPLHSQIGHHVRKLVHQMNNSLAIIMGSTQLLSMNSRSAEKMQTDIEKIYSELGRMALVVESLQEYAHSLCETTGVVAMERHSV
jgi:signal transduction histidine kinase